ncbi:MAG: RsmD family RNA methyltransferase [Thermoplasmata archaeon]|nr:RsmD family RNA methyltransferase [Thermoplasmata archaeon]MCI4358936.1 RsmD family RNA methyltransferase [Thermoplasmata archaeon]
MTEWLVELSAENLPLARAELLGAVRALLGHVEGRAGPLPRFDWVVLPDSVRPQELAGRLALARRVVRPWSEGPFQATETWLRAEATRTPVSASFRPATSSSALAPSKEVGAWAEAWKAGGGRIDLVRPTRRFLTRDSPEGVRLVGEEIAPVDRRELDRRRMPRLPFQRPVSLPPKLARAASNLASIRAGDRVVDPFVGTGALLLEAALLGARVSGVDRDAEMVRGTLQNLARFGVEAERLVADDGESASQRFEPGSVKAILTDPPYGRASGSAGEEPERLVRRVLSSWSDRVVPGGRIVVITPGGPDPLDAPWLRTVSVADRVHRSLTREFRVYERPTGPAATAS